MRINDLCRGRNAGMFHWVHDVAVDSEGNFCTAEVNQGRRAQKFVVDHAGHTHGSSRGPARQQPAEGRRTGPVVLPWGGLPVHSSGCAP